MNVYTLKMKSRILTKNNKKMYYYYDPYNDICFKSDRLMNNHYELELITQDQYYSMGYR